MAATRLTDSQKRELVARYCAGEGSSELAVVYGCSMNTVSRAVKAALAPEDYERLKQERARASRSGTPAPSAPPDSKALRRPSRPRPRTLPPLLNRACR
jgi:hypothetical protein